MKGITMSIQKLLNELNNKSIILKQPKMDNSQYTEALEFITGNELNKLIIEAHNHNQQLENTLKAFVEFVENYSNINDKLMYPKWLLKEHDNIIKELKK